MKRDLSSSMETSFDDCGEIKLVDWGGNQIDAALRERLRPGNIVRITEGCYVRITKKCGNKFMGSVEDPYLTDPRWYTYRNGDERSFAPDEIIEIPLNWKGNKNLLKNVVYVAKK